MLGKLTKQLIKAFPRLYDKDFIFECKSGWYDLLYDLSQKIDNILSALPKDEYPISKDGEIVQVKNKFGGLRYYTYLNEPQIDELIRLAEEESYKTCEGCGSKKMVEMNKPGWMTPECLKCRILK